MTWPPAAPFGEGYDQNRRFAETIAADPAGRDLVGARLPLIRWRGLGS